MTDIAEQESHIDGRVARRERNIDAVLDVVLEMFAEDMLFPTIEQASKRSGLSLRSLYRYFADPGELVAAAIKHDRRRAAELTHLSQIGQGPFGRRVDDFVSMRIRLYEAHGPIYRATIHNAAAHSRVRDELQRNRSLLREQFELQFAPELAALAPRARVSVVEAGNLLTQLDSIDLLRRFRNLTVVETTAVLRDTLSTLLTLTHHRKRA
ncbi:MAG: TetR/AcrR family transcriptional regulator [Ilumatobacteraceae bacterium]